ncbi:NEP1-interacting protein 2-like [Rutidosis leptorrhynchoides]|uniref:NEP1-interacting protein 2-like n=1 Tax=Rutidosis leptorrhynchoides TaxID=125765 RepID=UPI003A9918CE
MEVTVFFNVLNRVFLAFVTCIITLGGALVGMLIGTIKGPATELGLVRGGVVGAVTGALTALQVMDMIVSGEPFSKVSLLHSLVNGEIVADWVTPAVLKAYQSQDSDVETFVDIFDVFESNNESKGLCEDEINKLPKCMLKNYSKKNERNETNSCAICLHDFKNREEGRLLPNCRHVYHVACIDKWLIRNGSCPICRRDV